MKKLNYKTYLPIALAVIIFLAILITPLMYAIRESGLGGMVSVSSSPSTSSLYFSTTGSAYNALVVSTSPVIIEGVSVGSDITGSGWIIENATASNNAVKFFESTGDEIFGQYLDRGLLITTSPDIEVIFKYRQF